MNLRNIIKKTWTTGLLIFGMLVFWKNNKTIEVSKNSSKDKQIKFD